MTYKLPNFKELLSTYPVQDNGTDTAHNGEMLEAQLGNFGVKGTVVDIHPGPVITQYEIRLSKGQKSAEVEKIAQDLAIALQAKSIRVLTPIPGKGTIGIEIPNKQPQTVFLKDVLENTDVSDMKIPLTSPHCRPDGFR